MQRANDVTRPRRASGQPAYCSSEDDADDLATEVRCVADHEKTAITIRSVTVEHAASQPLGRLAGSRGRCGICSSEDDADDLAAEVRSVADHQKLVSLLDCTTDRLVTSTKLCHVSTELASITNTFTELVVQLVKLIRQETYHNEVHCLRKTYTKTYTLKTTGISDVTVVRRKLNWF